MWALQDNHVLPHGLRSRKKPAKEKPAIKVFIVPFPLQKWSKIYGGLWKYSRTTKVRLNYYNLVNCINVGLFGFASFGKKLVWNEISWSECLLQWPLVSRLWMSLLHALTLSPFVKLELDLQMEPWNHLNWSYKRADWCMEQRENRRKERVRKKDYWTNLIKKQVWTKRQS